MNIKVLGSGCANCKNLEMHTLQALEALGLTAEVEHVTEYADILSYGIMKTPGLVIDGEVVVSGRVPKVDEIAELISQQSTLRP